MRPVFALMAAMTLWAATPAAADPAAPGIRPTDEMSAQSRRRARTRVTVRPLRDSGARPVLSSDTRECRAVFTQRNIPQWGGPVLYMGQDCRWVR